MCNFFHDSSDGIFITQDRRGFRYPIENAAYTTPVGKISKPFRTQFGYHIIKVLDKKADRGQVH